jgi:hypothetical protein
MTHHDTGPMQPNEIAEETVDAVHRALKSIWRTLPDVEHARDYAEKTRILQRIVAICINEYFAD